MKNPRIFLESCYCCPFQIMTPSSGGECAVKRQNGSSEQSEDILCGYSNHLGIIGSTQEPIICCRFIEILAHAFESRDYDVIHEYYKKILNIHEWKFFVLQTTGVTWDKWITNIGRRLIRKCQVDPNASFKALIPK